MICHKVMVKPATLRRLASAAAIGGGGPQGSTRAYSLWRPPWWSSSSTLTRRAPTVVSATAHPFDHVFGRMDRELRQLEREMDRMMSDNEGYRGSPWWFSSRHNDSGSPADLERLHFEQPIVQEDGQTKFKMVFDVSRFKPEEIDVKTQNNKLRVHAKHSSKDKNVESKFEYLREYTIPDHVTLKEMTCRYNEDGTLVVEAPYNPPAVEAKKQEIQIKHE